MLILECWKILCELAPWLLLGMLLSGLMHVMLPKNFVKRKLQGAAGVIKAVALGVPLPLCSCGVIPAGIGLKNQGASNGAAVGFLISTPQTGIDSILVSASFFGWPFAIFKMVTAAITGVLGGWLTDRLAGHEEGRAAKLNLHQHESNIPLGFLPKLIEVWNHGLEIVRSIWVWLLLGVLISGLIETIIPDGWLQSVGQWGLLPAMLLMLVVSLPLYVCATASVPIAAAIVHGGLPPAAALVFLMAGPATNITTIGAIHQRFGWRTTTIYLSTIIFGSMFFAWLFDWLLTAQVTEVLTHTHDHQNWWSIASAVVLLLMIGYFIVQQVQRSWRGKLVSQPGEMELAIPVSGMTCGNCVSRLEKALRENKEIQSAQVTLNPGEARVVGHLQRNQVETIIQNAGFEVGR